MREARDLTQSILSLLAKGPLTMTGLKDALKVSDPTLRKSLTQLVGLRKVVVTGRKPKVFSAVLPAEAKDGEASLAGSPGKAHEAAKKTKTPRKTETQNLANHSGLVAEIESLLSQLSSKVRQIKDMEMSAKQVTDIKKVLGL